MTAEAARQGQSLPPGAALRPDGVIQLFMTSFHDAAQFDAAGCAAAEYLLAQHAGEPGDVEFSYHSGRRVTEIRFVAKGP